jgi:protocatechuate 3,4-dioxygenase, beta subunit
MSYHGRIISRRELLGNALALGGLALIHPVGSVFAQEAERQLTLSQGMGPFYPLVKPLDRDADLTIIRGRSGRAQGQMINLTGRVLNLKGEPVRGARIELWQADTNGRYAHPSDPNTKATLDPNFQGYATQLTDAEGRYRFKTIKPGAYPSMYNPGRTRPPHIHFDVTGRKDRLVTQMYFPNEPLNEQDGSFRGLGARQATAIGRILPPPKEVEPDALFMVWDVVLPRG